MSHPCKILTLSPPFAELSYLIPNHLADLEWPAGLRIIVPIRERLRIGIFLEHSQAPPEGISLRPLVWPAENFPIINKDYLDFARDLTIRSAGNLGGVISSLLPIRLKDENVTFSVQEEARGIKGEKISARSLINFEEKKLWQLAELWKQGRMRPFWGNRNESLLEIYTLINGPPWPVRPGAKLSHAVLNYLLDNGPSTKKRLKESFGPGVTRVLSKLLASNLVRLFEPEPLPLETDTVPDEVQEKLPLTEDQKVALADILPLIAQRQFASVLVHGVTGSGKTRVYLESALACLEHGRSALLLAPEISLALALFRVAQQHLQGQKIILYHGSLAPKMKEKIFQSLSLESQEPYLLVGTRSALLLPLKNIGLVIIDEEHDSSFKQEERLPYGAKEVAYFWAERYGAVLVLGSATPDLKTYHAAISGRMGLVSLKKRVVDATLPLVELINLNHIAKSVPAAAKKINTLGSDAIFATEVREKIIETVEKDEQVVILLNRRGYAPVLYCQKCGQSLRCSYCDVSLTYHKKRERLVCHYCGSSRPFPCPCSCGGYAFLPMSAGTELLEEKLLSFLPAETGVLRLDRDSVGQSGKIEEKLLSFARQEARVLLGTQMLSKGHHFPEVTLVVVTDGDLGRNFPDFRAQERSFQLLVQVSGRAGRGVKPGKVLIQTRSPEHPFWKFVLNADFEGFQAQEMERRKVLGYPPFVKLGLLRLSFPVSFNDGVQMIRQLGAALAELAVQLDIKVLGPSPAPLSRVKNRERWHILLKSKANTGWRDMRELFFHGRNFLGARSKLRLVLDLDPVDML